MKKNWNDVLVIHKCYGISLCKTKESVIVLQKCSKCHFHHHRMLKNTIHHLRCGGNATLVLMTFRINDKMCVKCEMCVSRESCVTLTVNATSPSIHHPSSLTFTLDWTKSESLHTFYDIMVSVHVFSFRPKTENAILWHSLPECFQWLNF